MKILSDFDGVLTDQIEEAHRVREIFRDELAQASGAGTAVDEILAQAEVVMDREPWKHGWKSAGRVTAFANEDLFIRCNGLGACLDQMSGTVLELRDVMRKAGHASFTDLAQFSYMQMVKETQAGKLKPMDSEVAGLFATLLSQGHEIVVVSNSGTQRILDLFKGVGVDAVAHDASPQAKLRVRGGAKKFELGQDWKTLTVGRYNVELNRPFYERILREEKPDMVIGDVFSLDLALPLSLARENALGSLPAKLLLRTQSYTPSWSKEFFSGPAEPAAVLATIDSIGQVERYITS